MYFQSFINKLKGVQGIACEILQYLNECLQDDNDQTQQNHENSDLYESTYCDEKSCKPQSSNSDEFSDLSEIIDNNEITDFDEKLNKSTQANQNENENIEDLKKKIQNLKEKITNFKNDISHIIGYHAEIINDAIEAMKLPNRPFARRFLKLTPYIFNWISSAATTSIDEKLYPKIKSFSYLVSGTIGSLFNVGSSFLTLMYVRSNKWEAFKEALMWGGSFFAEHLSDFITSNIWKDNSYSCIHDVLYDSINSNNNKKNIHNIHNIINICGDYFSNHFNNDPIEKTIDLIFKRCLITNLGSVWVSKLITILIFTTGIILIKWICDCCRKCSKNNKQKDESF